MRTDKATRRKRCLVMTERRANGALPSRVFVGRTESYLEIAQRVIPPWLVSRLSREAGLDLTEAQVNVTSFNRADFDHAPGVQDRNRITVAITDTSGVAVVRDPAMLRAAVLGGIGGACSYGCGLLLVRRAS